MKSFIFIPFRNVIILLFFLLFFTGCIEIIEEITVNKDKSGTISYRIETTEGSSLFSSLTSLFTSSVEDQLRIESDKYIGKLLKQPGITNIQYDLKGRSGSYFLQFDFSDDKSFNNALYAISGNKKTFFAPGYIKIGKNRFKKINFSPWLKKYLEREKIEIPNSVIAEMISFRSILHTPENIKRTSPGNTVKKRSDSETYQLFKLTEILENKVNTKLKVGY